MVNSMDKVLVNLYVPCIDLNYDVYIPVFLSVKEVVQLLINALVKLTDGNYPVSGQELLCEKGRQLLLDNNHRIQEYDIKNGDELILI